MFKILKTDGGARRGEEVGSGVLVRVERPRMADVRHSVPH